MGKRRRRRRKTRAFRNEEDKIMGLGVSSLIHEEKRERLDWILSSAATVTGILGSSPDMYR
jgi:hypothetical protein